MYPAASNNLLLLLLLLALLAFGIVQSNKRKFCQQSLGEGENDDPAGCIVRANNPSKIRTSSSTGLPYCRIATNESKTDPHIVLGTDGTISVFIDYPFGSQRLFVPLISPYNDQIVFQLRPAWCRCNIAFPGGYGTKDCRPYNISHMVAFAYSHNTSSCGLCLNHWLLDEVDYNSGEDPITVRMSHGASRYTVHDPISNTTFYRGIPNSRRRGRFCTIQLSAWTLDSPAAGDDGRQQYTGFYLPLLILGADAPPMSEPDTGVPHCSYEISFDSSYKILIP